MRIYISVFLLMLSVFLNGCHSERMLMIPEMQVSKEINVKIRELGISIESINEEKVLRKLSPENSLNFKNRFRELKISYNKTSSLIRTNYKPVEKREIDVEYINTKIMWDYIAFNFPI